MRGRCLTNINTLFLIFSFLSTGESPGDGVQRGAGQEAGGHQLQRGRGCILDRGSPAGSVLCDTVVILPLISVYLVHLVVLIKLKAVHSRSVFVIIASE